MATEGHSWSPVFVPIKSDFLLGIIILTDILSCTISKVLRITGQMFAFDEGVPLFNTLVLSEPLNS